MNLSVPSLIALLATVACYFGVVFAVDRALTGRAQAIFRYVAIGAAIAGFFAALHYLVDDRTRCQDISKALIAIAATACIFYEQHRVGLKRPIAERWKRFAAAALAIAAMVAYFEGFAFGSPHFYHRWEHFHYYMGAKYFPEMGYDGLYKCTVIAQDESGVVTFSDEDHIGTGKNRIDMSAEVRHPDKKIRNLGGDNMLMPVTDVLAHPETCKSHFSIERWDAFKADVRFFRLTADKKWWGDMQNDHGYNPPPVWTILGRFFSNLHPATTHYLQFLSSLDLLLMTGMFGALWWAFGWRVCAVAAIYFGCQSPAPFTWTGGAFLRQDWLFLLVLSTCLTRKRWYFLAGAAMVYSALLRIFPGLVVIGWLVVAGAHLVKHRTLSKPQWRMLAGGTLAAALLLPLSLQVGGRNAYKEFYEHTLKVHDRTPLTNHMGLRVLVGQKVPFEIPFLGMGTGPESGRVKYVKDDKLRDPFEVFMRMRNERYDRYKPVAYGIIALSIAFFAYVVRRFKSLWIAQCLGQIFIILMSQLTSYYYSFMILLAPLTKVSRKLEAPIFGLAAITQFVGIIFGWLDDKYWVLTAVTLGFCYGLLCFFRKMSGTAAASSDDSQSEPAS